MGIARLITAIVLCSIGIARAYALPPVSSTLVASNACPAFQSISKKTNNGNVTLTPGQSYAIVAHNKEPPSWLLVQVEGAEPARRWVAIDCGQWDRGSTYAPPTPGPAGIDKSTYLLSLSWEPAFCRAKGDKAECQSETAQSADAKQLSLHGLWPQPDGTFYCLQDRDKRAQMAKLDEDHAWASLPDPGLSRPVRDRLAAVMPGTQSLLERHEWIKHGTCSGMSPDAYFSRAAELVEEINQSAVGQFISTNVGHRVTAIEIIDAFKTAFGQPASIAVDVTCAGGAVTEIDIYLTGDVTGSAPLAGLLHKADKPGRCPSGGVLVEPRT